MELGAFSRLLKAVGSVYPDATVRNADGCYEILLDPDLTSAERRRIARERRKPPMDAAMDLV